MRGFILLSLLAQLAACTGPTPPPKPAQASAANDSAAKPAAQSPDSLKKEMTEEIDRFVKAGFYDSIDLPERVMDMFDNEKFDTGWVVRTTNSAWRKGREEQAGWPATTDVDRLVKVFNSLNSAGILSLHNAGNTKDEGVDDATDIRDSLKAKNIRCRGFCCYDSQDVDAAIDGNLLYLTFGDFGSSDGTCVKIGTEIVAALHHSGFKTQWNRNCQTRIMIKPFVWHNRLGGKEWGYDHAKELIQINLTNRVHQ